MSLNHFPQLNSELQRLTFAMKDSGRGGKKLIATLAKVNLPWGQGRCLLSETEKHSSLTLRCHSSNIRV